MTATSHKQGRLFGVGVGPGDPELLTLKAVRLIGGADVVAYPQPDSGPSFARAIAADYLPQRFEDYPIVLPMDSAPERAQAVYDRTARELGTRLEQGQRVVVLCEGDPFFYGSFLYLHARMADRFDVRVVPAVSSVMAAAALNGQPLGARNDIVTVIPAPLDENTIAERVQGADSAVIIKVGRHLEKIRRVLSRLGLVDCAHYVERATLDNQRLLPLASVDTAPYFSLILVHKSPRPRQGNTSSA